MNVLLLLLFCLLHFFRLAEAMHVVASLGHPSRSLKVCGLGWSFWLGWLYVTLVYSGSAGVGGLPGLGGLPDT